MVTGYFMERNGSHESIVSFGIFLYFPSDPAQRVLLCGLIRAGLDSKYLG